MKNQIRCYKLRKIALGVIFKKTKSSKRKTKTSVSMIFNLFSQIPMHITFVKKNIFLVHISFWNYISGKMPLSTNEILYKYIYYWPNNTVCLTEVLNLIFTLHVFLCFYNIDLTLCHEPFSICNCYPFYWSIDSSLTALLINIFFIFITLNLGHICLWFLCFVFCWFFFFMPAPALLINIFFKFI